VDSIRFKSCNLINLSLLIQVFYVFLSGPKHFYQFFSAMYPKNIKVYLSNTNPPRDQKCSHIVCKSNSKCFNFRIWCPSLIKTCWKICWNSSSLYREKFQTNPKCNDFLKAIWISQVQFEFTKLHFDDNFKGLYLLHPMFFSNKICWIMFPLKSNYCRKKFMSIQVLNVWEQFKVQNPDIFGLHWTLAACFFFIL